MALAIFLAKSIEFSAIIAHFGLLFRHGRPTTGTGHRWPRRAVPGHALQVSSYFVLSRIVAAAPLENQLILL
jgi:hypothetical protein